MLGTLENKDKSHWREFVKPLVHAYNCTRNDVTGFTPYELMFGRQPRLPVDLAFGLPVSSPPKSHSHYVHDLKDRLEESYRVAIENSSKIAQRNKLRFDKRVIESTLESGDRVLVRNVRIRGKHKLADKWEPDIYIVVKKAGDLPVYSVRPEGQEGPLRTLHRDLLLPCGFLPVAELEEHPKATVNRPKTRQQSGIEVTDEADISGDHPDLEDQGDYYLPEHASNTGLIETRILTRSEPVPPRERRTIREKNRHVVEVHPAPTNSNEKEETCRLEKDHRCPDYERGSAERTPLHLPSPRIQKLPTLTDNATTELCMNQLDYPIPVEQEIMMLPESEEPDSLETEIEAVGKSKDSDTLPEPNIMDETLPVCSDLSFSDSSRSDRSSMVSEPSEEVSVEQTHECTDAGSLDEETNPPNVREESETPIRRSQRRTVHPERLQYSQLGNPLTFIAKSFVQSLNVAFADALQGFSYDDALTKAVFGQSCRCNGTYTPLGGEHVTHVTMPLK